MVQLCPHPTCTASYNLDDADEGKTFRCDQCGSLLLFESNNLSVISSSSREAADTSAAPRSISLGQQEKNPMLSSAHEQPSMVAAVFSWFLAFLFALGSFFVVLFFFLPLIDQASLSRQLARIEAGERQQNRLDDKLWNRTPPRRDRFDRMDRDRFIDKDIRDRFDGPMGGPPANQPNEEAQKKRKTERDEWEKTRSRLEDEMEDSRTSSRGRAYFYTWGMLFGFLILGAAAVGFLSFGPTNARRIFGGIVITAEVLMIFMVYFISYNSMRFGMF